jgi:hypothetical protein
MTLAGITAAQKRIVEWADGQVNRLTVVTPPSRFLADARPIGEGVA